MQQRRLDKHLYGLYARVWGMQFFFFSKVKQGQGEQLQAATSGLCEGKRSVLSSSVDRAELAISCQLFILGSPESSLLGQNSSKHRDPYASSEIR